VSGSAAPHRALGSPRLTLMDRDREQLPPLKGQMAAAGGRRPSVNPPFASNLEAGI
jgi:hypothetical protein